MEENPFCSISLYNRNVRWAEKSFCLVILVGVEKRVEICGTTEEIQNVK